jgi:hypothetical protein
MKYFIFTIFLIIFIIKTKEEIIEIKENNYEEVFSKHTHVFLLFYKNFKKKKKLNKKGDPTINDYIQDLEKVSKYYDSEKYFKIGKINIFEERDLSKNLSITLSSSLIFLM